MVKFQSTELTKISQMILSGDPELRKVAANILTKQRGYRLSFGTIFILLTICLVIESFVLVWVCYQLKVWYIVPASLTFLVSLIGVIVHLSMVAEDRRSYDFICKELKE